MGTHRHDRITNLIDRYFLGLDTATVDGRVEDTWLRRTFTEDVHLTSPVGDHEGLPGLAESQQAALGKFARTQHVGANVLIDLDGDRAAVRWNAIMTHVHRASTQQERGAEPGGHFDVGGTFTADA